VSSFTCNYGVNFQKSNAVGMQGFGYDHSRDHKGWVSNQPAKMCYLLCPDIIMCAGGDCKWKQRGYFGMENCNCWLVVTKQSKLCMVGTLQWVQLSEKGTNNQTSILLTFQYNKLVYQYNCVNGNCNVLQ